MRFLGVDVAVGKGQRLRQLSPVRHEWSSGRVSCPRLRRRESRTFYHWRVAKPQLLCKKPCHWRCLTYLKVRRHNLITRDRRKRTKHFRPDVLTHKPHTAVAEQEIASTGVPAAEAADPVPARPVVAKRILAGHRRRKQRTVHRFVARIGP